MGRPAAGKHKTTKLALVLVGLLGLFFIADLLWASSSSSPSNWNVQDPINFILPQPVHSYNNTLNFPNKVRQFTQSPFFQLSLPIISSDASIL